MPYVLPTPPAPNRKWYQDLGYLQGAAADKILSAFLASQGGMGSFQQRPTSASAQNPGSVTFPSGRTERAGYDPSQMGAGIFSPTTVRTSQGVNIPFEAISDNQATFNVPTRFGWGPSAQQQIQQLQLQKLQQENDPMMRALEMQTAQEKLRQQQMRNELDSGINAQIKQQQLQALQNRNDPNVLAQIGQFRDLRNNELMANSALLNAATASMGGMGQPAQSQSMSSLSPQEEQQLAELALSGDEEAISAARRLGLLGGY